MTCLWVGHEITLTKHNNMKFEQRLNIKLLYYTIIDRLMIDQTYLCSVWGLVKLTISQLFGLEPRSSEVYSHLDTVQPFHVGDSCTAPNSCNYMDAPNANVQKCPGCCCGQLWGTLIKPGSKTFPAAVWNFTFLPGPARPIRALNLTSWLEVHRGRLVQTGRR